MSVDVSHDPRTGAVAATVPHSTDLQVDEAVGRARAVAPVLAATPPAVRRAWLGAVADALVRHTDELARLADWESGLGLPRLSGEVARTADQLRFYGDVAVEGSHLGATLDPQHTLARINVPRGPVAVFGASNFPFAFGTLGNDTASALAAGCPVVVKAHPAHAALAKRCTELAIEAWDDAGGPAGAISSVHGLQAGVRLVQHPQVAAVGFTGSQHAGLALWRLAQDRTTPIPVYAEMGTVNPVVVTPAAADRLAEVSAGLVGSVTLGDGQFCTKPGLLLAPTGHDAASHVARSLERAAPRPVMLTRAIAESVESGIAEMVAAGATVVARVPGPPTGWTAPAAVLSAPAETLVPGSRLLEECFGPVVVVAEYADLDEALDLIGRLQGALGASLFSRGVDDDAAPRVLAALTDRVGRVVHDGWTTGVATTWAQHHGGPWPATSEPGSTSVGAAALARFVRPVTYQGLPDALLPEPLRASNPWGITRRIDGAVVLAGG